MIKKSIFIILTTLLCNTNALPQEKDNRRRVGDLIVENTKYLAPAFIFVSFFSAMSRTSSSPESNKTDLLVYLTVAAVATTAGCVIVEGINVIDKKINPSNQTDPEIKTDIKKSLELDQKK